MSGKWPKRCYPVALAEEGARYNSRSFARWLSERTAAALPLVFNIGGAYGLPETLKERCRETISLSSMTLPHRLCAVILIEQLYRACTILKGHPYHK